MKQPNRSILIGATIGVLGSLVSAAVITLFYQTELYHQEQSVIKSGRDHLHHTSLDDSFHLRDVFADLFFLVRECENTLAQDRPLKELDHLFVNLAESTRIYDQIRFIDASGMEALRINWSETKGSELVPPAKLQNKSSRYYFIKSIGLDAGQVYASELDLNIENDTVERPLKPMLRVAATVRDARGKVNGVIVLNFLGKYLLKGSNDPNLMELNSRGDWMAGGDPKNHWGRQLGHGRSFANSYPEIWEQIQANATHISSGNELFQVKLFSLAAEFPDYFHGSNEAPQWYLLRHIEDLRQASGTAELGKTLPWLAALCCLGWMVGGLIIGRLSWLRDSTLLSMQEAKKEADSANRAKSQFLAAMSHEIRTPMNGVLGMAQILGMSSLDEEQTECVEIIKISGDTLLGIIDDILDYSKIEAGRLTIEAIEECPREIIHLAVQLLDATAKKKGLSLETNLDASLPQTMLCDSVRIRQILFNLIGNSIKFTESGFVRVNARAAVCENGLSGIRIEVVDSGIGMTPKQMEKLFQPFSQADTSITRRFGGTGLGLTISQRLAEMMEGRIEVVSQPGKGSTFSLCLPENIPESKTKDMATQTVKEQSLLTEGCRSISGHVLIVDDDQVNRMVLSNLLGAMNIRTDLAEDGKTALAMTQKKDYRLIFLDIRMPDMDGYEVADRILAMPRHGAPPTLISVSASVLPEEQSISFEHGMSDFIAKPVRIERLEEVIRKCLLGQQAN